MSYPRLTAAIEQVLQPAVREKLQLYSVKFQEALDLARRLIDSHQVDVILAGSGNYRTLRNAVSCPLVEFEITGYDIMNVLQTARQVADHAALVVYHQPIAAVERYKDVLAMDLVQFVYHNEAELGRVMASVRERGYKVVIGSSIVCDYGEKYGLQTVFIYTEECIRATVKRALEIQESLAERAYRAELMDAVLNYAYSGILATDEAGVIMVANPMAERILGVKQAELLGQNIASILPIAANCSLSGAEGQEVNQLQKWRDKTLLTSIVPVKTDGVVRRSIITFQDAEFIRRAENKIRRELYAKGLFYKYTFADIRGSSRAIKECIALARQYAASDFTVLISGESGTGKELFAHSIHAASARKNEAFVAVNCAALPQTLLESELFGYEEGAFTGARKGGKAGLFELAHNGTIFLDEISATPPQLQARLLRVLQEKEVMRLGSDRVIPVNVRVIAATNDDLWQEVDAGRFRSDLYYRLGVLELRIPPLRQRRTDIPILARAFLKQEFPELYILHQSRWEEIFALLQAYDFPGNVRELQNVLKRLSILLPSAAHSALPAATLVSLVYTPRETRENGLTGKNESNAELKRLLRVLRETEGNRAQAAARLGISRTTLWRKLKVYGIQ